MPVPLPISSSGTSAGTPWKLSLRRRRSCTGSPMATWSHSQPLPMPGVPSARSWRRSSSSTAPSAITEAMEYSRCGSGCRVASNAGRSPGEPMKAGASARRVSATSARHPAPCPHRSAVRPARHARCATHAAGRSRRCRRPATAHLRRPVPQAQPIHWTAGAARVQMFALQQRPRLVFGRAPVGQFTGAAAELSQQLLPMTKRCRIGVVDLDRIEQRMRAAGAAIGQAGGRIRRSDRSCGRPVRARRSAGAAVKAARP